MRRLFAAVMFGLTVLIAPVRAVEGEGSAVWRDTVEVLARSITREIPGDALAVRLLPSASSRRFGETTVVPADRLLEQIPTMRAVAILIGADPAVSLASDLWSEIQNDDSIPQEIRDQFSYAPGDERRANSVAARWLAAETGTSPGDPVAMIVLFDDGTADLDAGRNGREPVAHLVLLRGERINDDDIRISRIVHGPSTRIGE